MSGEPVKIGPFVGGMNTYNQPTSIEDDEAVEILNMDIDLDGSLVSRPAISINNNAPVTGPSHIIGTYRSKTGVFYIIYAFPNAAYALNAFTSAWTLIQAGAFSDTVQYNDKLWLVQFPSGTTQGGGSWDPTTGWTAVAAMPRGYSTCIYKERMFIAASVNNDTSSINRVKFSNDRNPASWLGTDTFDVVSGDGQDIMSLYVFDSSIVIFKTDSTYAFAYETQPTKGQLQVVSSTIGTNNNYTVVEYENSLFIMHEARVYRISNWQWEHTNIKVPFLYNNSADSAWPDGTSLSSVGNRILVRCFDNYYILGTKTGGWTRWIFSTGSIFPSEFIRDPTNLPASGINVYYAGNHNTSGNPWFKFEDQITTVVKGETYTARLKTKNYDYGVSYGFKRLFWWGADLLSKTGVQFLVHPIAYSTNTTWGEVAQHYFFEYQTWGRPLDKSIDVSDSSVNSNVQGIRTFTKVLKGLRFRQVQFTLSSTLDGSTLTGPFRIFSLTSFVDNKEIVSKKVS
jgi:hypothetical protein